MKNIKIFNHTKYEKENYKKIKDGIYEYQDENGVSYYCLPISFEQEPEFDEGESSAEISQYPMEDILDKFLVHVSDFFEYLNNGESNVCYYELSASNLKNIIKLKKSIIGKHIFNKEVGEEIKLVIKRR